MEHVIDAKEKSMGRVASEAALLLMGKDSPSYVRNRAPKVKVRIVNAKKLSISQKKKENETYKSYSGYPGGLKEIPLGKFIENRGIAEALRKTVRGMLPANKLRADMLKNLVIEE